MEDLGVSETSLSFQNRNWNYFGRPTFTGMGLDDPVRMEQMQVTAGS